MKHIIPSSEFTQLVEQAIKRTKELNKELIANGSGKGTIEASEIAIENLERLKKHISEGTLPRASKGEVPKGTGLGVSRAIGEWTEDDELIDRVKKIEEFFEEKW